MRSLSNQRGFAHIIVPVVAVVLVATIGTYLLVRSKAETTPTVTGLSGYSCGAGPAPTLRQGSTGSCVKLLQTGLNNFDRVANYFAHKIVVPILPVDGRFGVSTTTAVKYFQTHHAIAADGVVGPKTWLAFNNSCLVQNGGNIACFASGVYN